MMLRDLKIAVVFTYFIDIDSLAIFSTYKKAFSRGYTNYLQDRPQENIIQKMVLFIHPVKVISLSQLTNGEGCAKDSTAEHTPVCVCESVCRRLDSMCAHNVVYEKCV